MPRKKQYQWQNGECHQGKTGPSRSEKKRESLALQKMGEALTRLPQKELQDLHLPCDLEEALTLYARINDREGRRRQLQFIGRLMREIDSTPIRTALDERAAQASAASSVLHMTELWRDRLLEATDDQLSAILKQLLSIASVSSTDDSPLTNPSAVQNVSLMELTLAARKATPKKPHARRLLFRALHRLLSR